MPMPTGKRGRKAGQTPIGSWRCPRCREVHEPAFDVCWKCGTDRGAVVEHATTVAEEPTEIRLDPVSGDDPLCGSYSGLQHYTDIYLGSGSGPSGFDAFRASSSPGIFDTCSVLPHNPYVGVFDSTSSMAWTVLESGQACAVLIHRQSGVLDLMRLLAVGKHLGAPTGWKTLHTTGEYEVPTKFAKFFDRAVPVPIWALPDLEHLRTPDAPPYIPAPRPGAPRRGNPGRVVRSDAALPVPAATGPVHPITPVDPDPAAVWVLVVSGLSSQPTHVSVHTGRAGADKALAAVVDLHAALGGQPTDLDITLVSRTPG